MITLLQKRGFLFVIFSAHLIASCNISVPHYRKLYIMLHDPRSLHYANGSALINTDCTYTITVPNKLLTVPR